MGVGYYSINVFLLISRLNDKMLIQASQSFVKKITSINYKKLCSKYADCLSVGRMLINEARMVHLK